MGRQRSPAWLHAEQTYRDMVGPEVLALFPHLSRDREQGAAASFGAELRDVGRHITAIVNILVSIGAVFFVVMHVFSAQVPDVGLRTLLALLGAAVIAVAEGYFYFKYVLLAEDAATEAPATKNAPLAPASKQKLP